MLWKCLLRLLKANSSNLWDLYYSGCLTVILPSSSKVPISSQIHQGTKFPRVPDIYDSFILDLAEELVLQNILKYILCGSSFSYIKIHCNQVFLCCVFRHGPLFSVQVLKRQFVVVNSFDLVWDVLVKRSAEFSGRIKSYRSGLCLGEDVFSKVCGSCANCQMKIIRKIIRKFMTQLVCRLYLNSNPH